MQSLSAQCKENPSALAKRNSTSCLLSIKKTSKNHAVTNGLIFNGINNCKRNPKKFQVCFAVYFTKCSCLLDPKTMLQPDNNETAFPSWAAE